MAKERGYETLQTAIDSPVNFLDHGASTSRSGREAHGKSCESSGGQTGYVVDTRTTATSRPETLAGTDAPPDERPRAAGNDKLPLVSCMTQIMRATKTSWHHGRAVEVLGA